MKRFVIVTALAVAAALLVPTGTAAWSTYGATEPSSSTYDTSQWMFQDKPGSATDKVYFSVINGEQPQGAASVSPNSELVGDRIASPGTQGFFAILGVWIDCNHDGYIGLGATAAREYRAEESLAAGHPVDTAICPQQAESAHTHYSTGSNWVTEMFPIGYSTDLHGAPASINTDLRTISDLSAKVWGEHAAPGAPLPTPSCTTFFGAGQFGHTGGDLQHVDCLDGHAPNTVRDDAVGAAPALGVIPEPSSLWATGSTADKSTTGSEDSSNSFVTYDCGQKVATVSQIGSSDNKNGKGNTIYVPSNPRNVNPNGNVAGTVNETVEHSPLGDCDTTDDYGHDLYSFVETNGPDQNLQHHMQAGMHFQFRPWNNRAGTAANAASGCGGTTGNANVCGTPTDAGYPAVYNLGSVGYNGWISDSTSGTAPNTVAVRGTQATFFTSDYWTFYASVTAGDGTTPAGGQYGSEYCSSIGTNAPDQNGWACDPGLWNIDPNTGAKRIDALQYGTVGDSPQLRDVDCYDTQATSAAGGVGAHSVPVLTAPGSGCQ